MGKMNAAMIVALLGMANAANLTPALKAAAVEWKGIFYTPDSTYKWSAEKKNGAYADATMKIVMIPAPAPPTGQLLDNADAAAVAALNTTCVNVQAGGTMAAMEGRCYNLVFNQAIAKSVYTITRSGSKRSIAFYCQHVPTEFEDTQHYLKDTSGGDIEPVAQYPDGGHSHCHGSDCKDFSGFCVCKAKKNNWKLNCANKAPVTAAIAVLDTTSNGCKRPSNAATGWKPTQEALCKKNYYILQAHHDHCLHDQLPTNAEKKLHDYEKGYEDCFIKRQYSRALSNCPAVQCATSQGQAAITTAIANLQNPANNCGSEKLKISNATHFNDSNCAVSVCSAAIKTVLMAHDTCLESQLPNNLETALHDYEARCENQLCNSASAPFDPYAQDCGEAEAPASGFGTQVAFLVTALLLYTQL